MPTPGEPVQSAKKLAAVLSVILWTAGFLLAFVISPSSPMIWLPDLLLLLGFLPLLQLWKPVWPWLIFGALNLFVGFVLLVVRFFPDGVLSTEMAQVQQHLAQYHEPKVWILLGLAAILYGLGRLFTALTVWLSRTVRSK